MSVTRTSDPAKSSKRKASFDLLQFRVVVRPVKGVSVGIVRQYLEDAAKGWAGQFMPDDERFGLGDEVVRVARIRRTQGASRLAAKTAAGKAVPKKIAPLLFTVRVNTEEELSRKTARIRDVASRLSLEGVPAVKAVRAKALDNAKGTAFTLKIPVGKGFKAREVASDVRLAVAAGFGEHAEAKRQYESRDATAIPGVRTLT